jgi:hypothetical protein
MIGSQAVLRRDVITCAAIMKSWRRRRLAPTFGWLLLASFPSPTAVGDGNYFVKDSIWHVRPFPSDGDAAFLSSYLLLSAGLLTGSTLIGAALTSSWRSWDQRR